MEWCKGRDWEKVLLFHEKMEISHFPKIYETYHFCPSCGSEYTLDNFREVHMMLHCDHCLFDWFLSSQVASCGIIPILSDVNRVIVTIRAMDPGKGTLDLPGGFLKLGEDPLKATEREIFEEIGLATEVLDIISTTMCAYPYKEKEYSVLELIYVMKPIPEPTFLVESCEIANVFILSREELLERKDEFVFQSQVEAVRRYLDFL